MKSRSLATLSLMILIALLLPLVAHPRLIQGESTPPALSSTDRVTAALFYKHDVDSDFYFHHAWAADVDGDTETDILASGSETYSGDVKIAWYRNTGSGFALRVFVTDSANTFRVSAARINGDSDMDLIGRGGYGLAWFENDGSESFTRQVISSTYATEEFFVADLDGSSAPDIVCAGVNDFSWWENDGSGAFTHRLIENQDKDWVHAADVDGDDDVDLVAAGNGEITWWENDGTASPTFSRHWVADVASPHSIWAVDMDDDTHTDILVSASGSPPMLAWWENNGSETFTKRDINSTDVWGIWSARPGDFDLDGDADVVGALMSDGLGWWENNGSEQFTYHNLIGSAYENVTQVEVFDVNKDDRPDLVSGRQGQVSGKEVNWFENGSTAPGTVKQARYRIGHDTPLSAMTWYAAAGTAAADVPRETNFRVRFQVYNDGGQPAEWQPQLEWSTSATSGFTKVPTPSGGAPFYVADTSQFSNGDTISTSTFGTGLGTGTAQAGVAYDTQNPAGSAISLTNGNFTEIEFNVRANANAAPDTMYFFRMTDAGAALNAYDVSAAAVEMAGAQGTVSGLVVDQLNAPLGDVSVKLNSEEKEQTAADGTYSFSASPGTHDVGFTKSGYWDAGGQVTVAAEQTTEANQVLVAQSDCLGADTNCALKLVSLLPLVGTTADLLEVASVSNDLCEVGALYSNGEYAQCAAKIALWLAEAANVPVISPLLDLVQGGEAANCVIERLDAVGQTLGKVALAFWDYIYEEPGQDVVFVFQLQAAEQTTTSRASGGDWVEFTLADSVGRTLSYSGGAIGERTIPGSFALGSNQDWIAGLVSLRGPDVALSGSSVDYTLHFTGVVRGYYDLDVIIPQSDGSSVLVTYHNLLIDQYATGELAIQSDSTDYGLLMDTNADGTPDLTVDPDSVERSAIRVYLPLVMRNSVPEVRPGWTYDVRVDDASSGSHQLFADLAIGPGGTLYAVWEDYRNGTYREGGDIYAAYSTDGGKTWSANLRVNDDAAANAAHRDPRIAASPTGDVYVVWEDWRNDPNPTEPGKTSEYSQNPDIYLAKLPAGQTSFQPNIKVFDNPERQFDPDVEVDGNGNVYVAWYDMTGISHYGNSVVAKSTNGGASFGSRVTVDNHSRWALDPRLAINRTDNTIHLVYQGHPDYYKPYFTRSTDGGATWSTDVRLDAGANRDWFDAAREIRVAADGSGHVLVIWADERNDPDNCYTGGTSCHDEFDIYVNYSGDGGVTWLTGDNVMVNDDSTYNWIINPSTAFTPDGTLIAVWRDSRTGDDLPHIYMATSSDFGASWSTNTRVDHAPGGFEAYSPVVAADQSSGLTYVLWHDKRNGDLDIYVTSVGKP